MVLGCGFIDVDRFQKRWSLLLKEVPDQDDCVHLHGNQKGKISEKVVLRVGPVSGVHLHGNLKGKISEKVVLRERWSMVRCLFT